MKKSIVSIQYLRALAAMMVVYHHAAFKVLGISLEPFIPYSGFGAAGVDVFFVISGFIMWITTVRKNQTPAYFWYRRIIRIVPLYWFFIMVIVVPKLLEPAIFTSVSLDATHILKSLFFIPHYHPVLQNEIWPILIPGWTLNYEMFFYLLFGGSLFLPGRMRLVALAVTFTLLVITGSILPIDNAIYVTFTDTLLLEFLMGIVLGALYTRGLLPGPVATYGLLALSIFLFVAFEASTIPEWERFIAWGIPAALLVWAALALDVQRRLFHNQVLQRLGDASYSIYLSHILTIEVVELLWEVTGWQTASAALQSFFIAVCLVSSALVGMVTYLLIESPMLRYLKNWGRDRVFN